MATDPKLQEWVRFEGLVRAWKKGRATSSSVEQIISAPEYLSIIGMGETAIPFLLSQLKQEGEDPDMWFWALASITGENPVSASDAGNFKKMAESWLEWGQQEGYAG